MYSKTHRIQNIEYWKNMSYGDNLMSTLGQAGPIAQWFFF
jgi:hypothetical protein